MRMLLTAMLALAINACAFGADEPKKDPELTLISAYEIIDALDLHHAAISEPLKKGNTVVLYSQEHAEIMRLRKDGTLASFNMLKLNEECTRIQFAMTLMKLGEKTSDDLPYISLKGMFDIDREKDTTHIRLAWEQAGVHSLEALPEGYTQERLTNEYVAVLRMVYNELNAQAIWQSMQPVMAKAKDDAAKLKKKQEQLAKESTEAALRLLKEADEMQKAQQKLEEEGKLLEKIFRDMYSDDPEETDKPEK